jgi:NAD(P)-dependent dehydrogenase (short-subunit alcohol dehydrogenase family)
VQNLNGKVILVTGASRGIGRAIAIDLANHGAVIGVHYNQNTEEAKNTLGLLKSNDHFMIQGNFSKPDCAEKTISEVENKAGRIDMLVNNAGIFYEIDLVNISFDQWQKKWIETINTNLLSPVNLSFLAAKSMIKYKGGKIINISSRGAFRGEPNAPYYGASKAGLNSFSQSMAKALAPYNIFVYSIAPGFVDTDMAAQYLQGEQGKQIKEQSPLNRVARSEEIASLVTYLCGENTEYLTGSIIDVNGASYLRS